MFAPLPHYVQSGDRLDEILTEIAAILHPEVYPDYKWRYFRELPDKEPVAPIGAVAPDAGQQAGKQANNKQS